MRHVLITGAFWRFTLVVRIRAWAVFIIFEEELLFGSPSVRPSFISLSLGTPDNYLLLLRQFSFPGQKPKAQHVMLGLYPYNSSSKFRFFHFHPRRKVGFWFPRDEVNWHLDLHVWEYGLMHLIIAAVVSKFMGCHWLLQAAPCSPDLTVRRISNDGPFFLKFERDNSHLIFPPIKGAWRTSFSSFCKSFQIFKNSLQCRLFVFRKFSLFPQIVFSSAGLLNSLLSKDFLVPLVFT